MYSIHPRTPPSAEREQTTLFALTPRSRGGGRAAGFTQASTVYATVFSEGENGTWTPDDPPKRTAASPPSGGAPAAPSVGDPSKAPSCPWAVASNAVAPPA